MRRKLTTLKYKSGASQNGAPRSLIDETVYRSHRNNRNAFVNSGGTESPHWDPKYSGWSNPSRPRDFAIFLRGPVSPTGGIG